MFSHFSVAVVRFKHISLFSCKWSISSQNQSAETDQFSGLSEVPLRAAIMTWTCGTTCALRSTTSAKRNYLWCFQNTFGEFSMRFLGEGWLQHNFLGSTIEINMDSQHQSLELVVCMA